MNDVRNQAASFFCFYLFNALAKQATIQTVIDNLHISTMEYRNESDPDVSPYTHNRNIELIPVKYSSLLQFAYIFLCIITYCRSDVTCSCVMSGKIKQRIS